MDFPMVVADIGSFQSVVGFAGDDDPRDVVRSLVAEAYGQDKLYGEMASSQVEHTWTYPFANGYIHEGEIDTNKLLAAIFMRVDHENAIENQGILISEPLGMSDKERKYVMEKFFETFSAPKFASLPAPLLTLISRGLTTGLVIDSGHRPNTDVCPIIDGQIDLGAVKSTQVSGNDIS